MSSRQLETVLQQSVAGFCWPVCRTVRFSIDFSFSLSRYLQLIFFVACLTCPANFAGANSTEIVVTDALPATMYVETTDGLLTIKARDVSIRALLSEIALKVNLKVVGKLFDRPISLDCDRLPLDQALGRILDGENFVLRTPPQSAHTGMDPKPSTLWVYARDSDSPGTTDAESGLPEAVKHLGEAPGDQAIATLTLALSDVDKNVRIDAVYALTEIGGDDAALALESVLQDESASVREEAVYGLGMIGGEIAVQILEQTFRYADSDMREMAIEAFTDIGGDESVDALAVVLTDSDASLRREAIDALGEIGGEGAIRILTLAFNDDDHNVRESAISALRDIGGDEAATALAVALQDAEQELRLEAVEALGDIGGQVAASLLQQAANGEEKSVGEAAKEILAEM